MAGQYFIYIPFNDTKFKKEADIWVEQISLYLKQEHMNNLKVKEVNEDVEKNLKSDPRARKIPIVCMHGDSSSLSNIQHVSYRDTVYVMAHCSEDTDKISDNHKNTLDAAGLIERMENDGLPSKDTYRIKLWACEGARGSDPFALKLYEAIKESKSFPPNIELTAYKISLNMFNGEDKHKRGFVDWITRWGIPFSADITDRPSKYAVHYPPRPK